MTQSYKRLLQIGNILFLIGTIMLNGLSNGAIREGVTIGSLSDKYFTLFAPAGITFSIWGVIYLMLIAFMVYQASGLFSGKNPDTPWLNKIGIWFMASGVFNSLWLVAWLYERLGVALVLMLGLLASLLVIYFSLQIGLKSVDPKVRYLVHLPFSIYLGWITVATVANVSSLLVSVGWEPPFASAEQWTNIMVIIAAVLGVLVTAARNDIAYGAVVMWALLGIIIKHNQLGPEGLPSVQLAAEIGIGLVLITAILNVIRQLKRGSGLGYI